LPAFGFSLFLLPFIFYYFNSIVFLFFVLFGLISHFYKRTRVIYLVYKMNFSPYLFFNDFDFIVFLHITFETSRAAFWRRLG